MVLPFFSPLSEFCGIALPLARLFAKRFGVALFLELFSGVHHFATKEKNRQRFRRSKKFRLIWEPRGLRG
jgi:hypothetical protein